ncbi:MAG: nucleotide sugar dehydrogenase [Ignisphaera sp.]
MSMRIAVIGLGRIGLPTAVVFASKGFQVVGIDTDANKVNAINKGLCYFHEPGLNEMLKKSVDEGNLFATKDDKYISQSNVIIIAVPTPLSGGIVNLSYIKDALSVVVKNVKRDVLVSIESTVPPGTMTGFIKGFIEAHGFIIDEDLFLVYSPERITPGKAVEELLKTPRIIGGVSYKSAKMALEVYRKINPNIYVTDAATAELVKLIENTYRDINIAYANLLALISEKIGVDVYEAIRLANTHPRVNIHLPGAGVGGPCLTKDPYMLASVADGIKGVELILLARRINEYMPKHAVNLVLRALKENEINKKEAKIAILGAAYKGDIDDTRESPSKYIIGELLEQGLNVQIYDPYTTESFGACRSSSLEDALNNSDIILVATDHKVFKELDWKWIAGIVRRRIIVDGRRIVEPHIAVKYGFKYYGIGYGGSFKI